MKSLPRSQDNDGVCKEQCAAPEKQVQNTAAKDVKRRQRPLRRFCNALQCGTSCLQVQSGSMLTRRA